MVCLLCEVNRAVTIRNTYSLLFILERDLLIFLSGDKVQLRGFLVSQ